MSVCGAFFAHIGMTQTPLEFSRKPHLELVDTEKKDFKKHPGLSGHLIRKSKIDLSKRCLRVINEHHERFDGSGYPYFKKGEHIELLSQIVGVVAHIFEFSDGVITGKKKPINSVIRYIKHKSPEAGLEFQFSDIITENIISLTNEDIKAS